MPPPKTSFDCSLRDVRLIAALLLFSALLYIYVGEMLGPKSPRDAWTFLLIFGLLSLSDISVAFSMRSRYLGSTEETLRSSPEDQVALGRWRSGQIISLVMCQTIALFGLILRILGGTSLQTIPFYLVSASMMLVWWPRRP